MQVEHWLQRTFLWVCIQRSPAEYLQGLKGALSKAQLLNAAMHQLVGVALAKLHHHGLVKVQGEAIEPLDPGRCACATLSSRRKAASRQASLRAPPNLLTLWRCRLV